MATTYFGYATAAEDDNNATGGGPVELISISDWSADKVDIAIQVTFTTVITSQTGANLAAQANSAIAGAYALAGVAAQFSFNSHTYLAIDDVGQLPRYR